jgi:hypothetical protein
MQDEYTTSEFIKKFRPDGKGHIRITDENGKVFFHTAFTEILCDICNDSIEQDKKDADKKVVWVKNNYALCEKCKDKM